VAALISRKPGKLVFSRLGGFGVLALLAFSWRRAKTTVVQYVGGRGRRLFFFYFSGSRQPSLFISPSDGCSLLLVAARAVSRAGRSTFRYLCFFSSSRPTRLDFARLGVPDPLVDSRVNGPVAPSDPRPHQPIL